MSRSGNCQSSAPLLYFRYNNPKELGLQRVFYIDGCNTSLGFQWRDMYLLFGFTIQSDLWTITLILPRDPKEIMLFYISVQREMRRWCDFVQGVSMTQKETHNTLYFIIPRCCAWNYLSNDTITSKTEKCSFPPSWLKLAHWRWRFR